MKKRFKIPHVFKSNVIFIFTLIIINLNCDNPVSKKCTIICKFSKDCAMKSNSSGFIAQKDMDNFDIQCFNTCTMLQDEFISCHEKNSQSCSNYFDCLMKSEVFN